MTTYFRTDIMVLMLIKEVCHGRTSCIHSSTTIMVVSYSTMHSHSCSRKLTTNRFIIGKIINYTIPWIVSNDVIKRTDSTKLLYAYMTCTNSWLLRQTFKLAEILTCSSNSCSVLHGVELHVFLQYYCELTEQVCNDENIFLHIKFISQL